MGTNPIRADLGITYTEALKSRALSVSSRARARYRYRFRVSGIFVEVALIIDVYIAKMRIPFINNEHNTDNGNGNGLEGPRYVSEC
jgi:hypothetical protein